MTFPPRLVSILVPIQCTIVLLTWGICAKFFNRKIALGSSSVPEHNSLGFGLAWLSAKSCWVLLLLPIAWGIVATIRADKEYGGATLQPNDSKVGWTSLVLVLFLSAAASFVTLNYAFAPPKLVKWPDGLPP